MTFLLICTHMQTHMTKSICDMHRAYTIFTNLTQTGKAMLVCMSMCLHESQALSGANVHVCLEYSSNIHAHTCTYQEFICARIWLVLGSRDSPRRESPGTHRWPAKRCCVQGARQQSLMMPDLSTAA
jgi:hypothetical protein